MNKKLSYLNFNNKNYYWKKGINYQDNPTKYKVGKGEQGVLICEPYKSEIGQYWKFKTPKIATSSSNKIYRLFLKYLAKNDFVGADMARKYLQMGYTRSRRYANYRGGVKYNKKNDYKVNEHGTGNPQKEISARIFFDKWKKTEANNKYKKMKIEWKKIYG